MRAGFIFDLVGAAGEASISSNALKALLSLRLAMMNMVVDKIVIRASQLPIP